MTSPSTDAFYRAFEERIRGSRDTIRARLLSYAPFLSALHRISDRPAALDLGCGRGEWLELLLEHDVAAQGVDLDDAMLAACAERSLPARHDDALGALGKLGSGQLAVVSAFHLVEHLPFEQMRRLVEEALRVLQPGGLLILETPNPENLMVGASSFYMDPTRKRPIPPPLLAFCVEFAGFARVDVFRLGEDRPLAGAQRLGLTQVLEGASPDYAVVAQKAGPDEAMRAMDAGFARGSGVRPAPLAVRYDREAEQAVAALQADLSLIVNSVTWRAAYRFERRLQRLVTATRHGRLLSIARTRARRGVARLLDHAPGLKQRLRHLLGRRPHASGRSGPLSERATDVHEALVRAGRNAASPRR